MRLALAFVSLVIACGKDDGAKPTAPQAATQAAKQGLVFGEATVWELVDRRLNKREPPSRDLVLHADGKVELFNDKTGAVMATLLVKPDGTVAAVDGPPIATIREREIAPAADSGSAPLAIDGNTITVSIEDEKVKVVLADDGNVTVLGRPDGNKWRIDAKDASVRRTAFLVLALQMKTALD